MLSKQLQGASLAVAALISPVGVAAETSADQQRLPGKAIYQQYCAACHGINGEGQPEWESRNALGELPAPPHDSSGHTWKHGDGMLYRIIRDGWRDPFNKTKHLTMPSFKEVLSPQEIRDVVLYLKTMWTDEQQAIQAIESKQKSFPPEALEGKLTTQLTPSKGK